MRYSGGFWMQILSVHAIQKPKGSNAKFSNANVEFQISDSSDCIRSSSKDQATQGVVGLLNVLLRHRENQ